MRKLFTLLSFVTLCNLFGYTQSGWTTLTSGTTNNLNSVFFTDANNGYAVSGIGNILKTTNAGTNWTAQTSGTTVPLWSVYFTDANTGYAVGYSGTILKTTNAGTNWSSQTSGTFNNLFSIYFTDANKGYAIGEGGTVLKTDNAGINWTAQTSGTTNLLRSIYFTDANTGFIVGDYGTILKTINEGINWTTQTIGTSNDLFSVYFTTPDTGYVGGSGNWKTTNGGINWSSLDGLVGPWSIYSIYFTNANTGYAVGNGAVQIHKTTNAGINWTSQYTGALTLNSVYFTDVITGYAVGNNGTILKTTTGGEPCLLSAINGAIHYSGGTVPANSATIELYKKNNVTDFNRIDTIALTGNTFQFLNVVSGDYRVRVKIDNNSFNPLVLNTYYDSVTVWNLADTLNVSCDSIYNIDIHLYEITPPIGAPTGNISGTIHYYSGAKGINAVNSPLDMGNPVTGGEIYIRLEPDDQPIANTETDTSGFYSFEGLPEGNTYSIAVDIPGLPLISTYTFSVTAGDTVFNNLNFYVDTSTTNGYITTDTLTRIFSQNINSEFYVIVYPNPSQNNLTVKYSLSKTQKVNIELFDIVGKKVETLINSEQQTGNYYYILNTAKYDFLKGIYFLKFSVDKSVYFKKVIIE